MQLQTLLKSTRPSFLILTPVCVFLGLSTAIASSAEVNTFHFLLILIAALAAHISVNTLNEYFDFSSGLDLITQKTAFSGGSGALPENPEFVKSVLFAGLLSLAITIAVGIYLISIRGMQILPLGILGVVIILTYTQWLNRFPLLCLFAPGLGFGVLMVVGTHVILTGEYTALPWLVSLIPFFLLNNLLLLNQYPDINADSRVGRKTFPIVYGMHKSHWVYTLFALAAYSLIIIYSLTGVIPALGVAAVLPAAFAFYAASGAFKYSSRIGKRPRYLAANVAASILTPLLLGVIIIQEHIT